MEIPIKSFTRHFTFCKGKVHLTIRVGQLLCLDEVFVMKHGVMIKSIIIGTPWQRKCKASIDWDTNEVKFNQEDGYNNQPFIQSGNLASTS